MKYGIGLDIGVASVGFATVMLDENDNPYRLAQLGSRIFEAAEHPKDGSSLALPRRISRGMRRRLRRKAHRKERLRAFMVQQGLLNDEQLSSLYCGKLEDIYELRTKALDEVVTNAQLAKIILHLAQRRGFKSNRKSDAAEKEAGLLLSAVSDNKALMLKKGYRTAGEMFFKDEKYAEHKRNKGESYLSTISRDMITEELHAIFSAQRGFGSDFATEDLCEGLNEILTSQRPFDVGPGGNSPYGGDQILKMWGMCTFEENELRAAKACYSFEYFNLLTKVNHMRILCGGKAERLTPVQRDTVLKLAHTSSEVSYEKLRKELNIPIDARFNDVRYTDDGAEACEKKKKLACLKAYHEIRKALDKVNKGHIAALSRFQLNEIGMAFTLYKTDDKIKERLKAAGLNDIETDALLASLSGFSKAGHLSVKACDKLIPPLEQGLNYNEACDAAGYNFKAHSGESAETLIDLKRAQEALDGSITSPVVKRAMSQTFKVINALIRKHGESPVYINIENARELQKQLDERRKIERDMAENSEKNERIMKRLRDEFKRTNATGLDLVKFKLYEEQAGVCLYSQKQLDITRLFEDGYVDIDHIIPYSICFDDTYKNKVLVLASENRQKGNRLPLEYLTKERRDKFIVWVNNSVRDYKKKQRLLKESITDEDVEGFKQRNLTDTQTISVFVANYLADNLQFSEYASGRKKHFLCIKGGMTSQLRKRWGFAKIRADGDTHHALDAVVIACTTDAMVKSVSHYSLARETEFMHTEDMAYAINSKTGEIKRAFPQPWLNFRNEVLARFSSTPGEIIGNLNITSYSQEELNSLRPVFVSRMPKRKVSGAAHMDTVRSVKDAPDNCVVTKTALSALKLDKNGEIENYFRPEDDRLLYNALIKRLTKFGGDGKKAFPENEPFYKPKADGTNGPTVKKVKIYKKSSLNVPIHSGTAVADNGGMVRVDVFYIEGDGYYLVPVYVSDTVKKELPNKAVVAHKPYDEWKEMSDKDFIFSIYPNDLIYVEAKKPASFSVVNKDSGLEPTRTEQNFYAYYNGTNISTASITVFNHDHSYRLEGMGVKTLPKLQKCYVDILGEISKAGKEKRVGFGGSK